MRIEEVKSKNLDCAPSVLVVSDFRAVPVAAAVDIWFSSRRVHFLVAEASLRNRDFGDNVHWLQKLVVLKILSSLGRLELVPSGQLINWKKRHYGFYSSLVSITRSLLATEEDFPEIARELQELEGGAMSVLARVRSINPQVLYLFNGRTVSSQPIAAGFSRAENPKILIYEWGGKKRRTYLLTPHPLHDTVEESRRLNDWARAKDYSFSEKQAQTFIKRKLTPVYGLKNHSTCVTKYSTVIFAGSPHEHAVVDIDNLSTLDADPLALVRAALAREEIVPPVALRLHPNMVSDPSHAQQIAALQSSLDPLGVEIISPHEKVSAQTLIAEAKVVVVGNSSVGLDSIFLGKWPVLVGHPPYRDLVDSSVTWANKGHLRALQIAGIMEAYEDPHVRRFRFFSTLIWAGLRILGCVLPEPKR